MTNQTEKPSKKQPGDVMIGCGAALGIIGLLIFVVAVASGGPGSVVMGMCLLMIAFGLAVIGYLQRIAARR